MFYNRVVLRCINLSKFIGLCAILVFCVILFNYRNPPSVFKREEEKDTTTRLRDGRFHGGSFLEGAISKNADIYQKYVNMMQSDKHSIIRRRLHKGDVVAAVSIGTENTTSTIRRCLWEERRKQLSETCKTHNVTKGPPQDLLVDHEYKMIFCVVHKAASSTMKRFFASLKHEVDESKLHDQKYMRSLGFTFLEDFSAAKQEELLRTYKKALVARHPFDRLRSCYYNKFVEFKHIGERQYDHVLRKYRINSTDTSPVMHFNEFVRYILEQPSVDPHWESIDDTCNPCLVKYDYIMKLETLTDDLKHLCKDVLRVSTTDVYMNKFHHGIYTNRSIQTQEKHLGELSELKPPDLEILYQKYEQDFLIFGYEYNNQTLNATCVISSISNNSSCC